MRNVSEKCCRENQTQVGFQYFFLLENRNVCEKMWENTVEPGRTQMTILRMRIICCVPQATDTHSEYAKFNTFPLQ
jgi:hypothetical protein